MAMQSQLEQPLVEQLREELEDFVPQSMDPGTVFVLENQQKLGDPKNPYVAAMSCPRCGSIGLITYRQLDGKEWILCGGECSAEWRVEHHLDETIIILRAPQ
jgi:hypothetical protein